MHTSSYECNELTEHIIHCHCHKVVTNNLNVFNKLFLKDIFKARSFFRLQEKKSGLNMRSCQPCGTNVMPLTQIHSFVSSSPTRSEFSGRKGTKNHSKLDLICQEQETSSTFCKRSSCPFKLLWRLSLQNSSAGLSQESFPALRGWTFVWHWGLQLGNYVSLPEKVILVAIWINLLSKA